MLLLRIGMLGEAIDLRQRRTDDIINNPTEPAKLFNIIALSDFHHVVFVLGPPGHAARFHNHSGGVCYDRLLEADLRPVGKAGHHRRILPPLLGKPLLRTWIPARILYTLFVTLYARRE